MSTKTIFVGDKFTTNQGFIVEVIEYINRSNIEVKFDDGTICNTTANKLRKGFLENRKIPSVFGVGFLGYGEYTRTNNYKAYSVWLGILERCYSTVFLEKLPYYVGCVVCEEWHNFQNFALWYDKNFIHGFCLDRNLLKKGNKIYSPKTCSFLPRVVISAIQQSRKSNGLPLGVSKSNKLFISQCSVGGFERVNESFKTIEEASNNYKKTKENYVKILGETYKNLLTTKSYKALQKWTV